MDTIQWIDMWTIELRYCSKKGGFHCSGSSYSKLLLFQNFSVCEDCGTLCGLYHRLHHMKQKLYVMCSEIVEKRKEDSPGIDTTQILNQLLADDVWLETVGEGHSFHAQMLFFVLIVNSFSAIQEDARLVGRCWLLRTSGSVMVILICTMVIDVAMVMTNVIMMSYNCDQEAWQRHGQSHSWSRTTLGRRGTTLAFIQK